MGKTLLGSLGALLIWLAPLSAEAVSIRFLPTSQDAGVGEFVDVQLRIEGLAGVSLSAYDLFVGFDPRILAFASVVFGDPNPVVGNQLACPGLSSSCTDFGSINDFEGQTFPLDSVISLFEFSLAPAAALDADQAAAFTLATLTFEALANGTSPLTIFPIALGDALGDPLTASVEGGKINVPEPSTLLLVLVCLMALAGTGARSHQSPTYCSRKEESS